MRKTIERQSLSPSGSKLLRTLNRQEASKASVSKKASKTLGVKTVNKVISSGGGKGGGGVKAVKKIKPLSGAKTTPVGGLTPSVNPNYKPQRIGTAAPASPPAGGGWRNQARRRFQRGVGTRGA